ncbi:MAG TPA: hypothetical protein VJL61_07575 [Rhodanobacteraceae bacterium]|nr:hypothetical protein [Rhodanobacteraceae bacterium]
MSALRTLGDTTTKAIIGQPKEGRGDEWSTYLPMLKQAYSEGFPERSTLKPYFEKLKWFIAIPHPDASLVFLPNYLAYWIVPGGAALSFQGFYYNAIFVLSVLWLLVNLGVKRRYALVCGFMLLFSQFYQVWWTSNFPVLGVSLLPFAIFTSRIRQPYKFVFLAWALGHLLFGEMYPPYILSIAIAIIPFILAARPDLLRPKEIAFAALAAGIALALYLALNWEYFRLVLHTSYPGQRINTGGGVNARSVLKLVFPTLTADADAGFSDNIYTLAMGGTILPLVLISLLPSINWDRRTVRLTIVSAVVGAFLIWYMLVGVPRTLAMVTPLYLIPGPRMAIGLSVLAACYCTTLISWHADDTKLAPLLLVTIFYAVISFLNRPGKYAVENFFAVQYYPWIFTALVVIGVAYYLTRTGKRRCADGVVAFVLIGMSLTQIVIYGSFNPIMRAKDILRPVHSQIINDWLALYKKNGGRSFATIGNYGDVLRGENLPALEAIHMVNVEPEIYHEVFPSLTSEQINELFNQFRGIAFANVQEMNADGPTIVFPVRPYTVSFANIVTDDKDKDTDEHLLGTGQLIITDVTGVDGKFTVFWNTHLLSPLPIADIFDLHLDCPITKSWMTRYPVVIPGEPLVPVALQGIAGQITVEAPTPEAAKSCVSALHFGVVNGK